MPRLPALQGLRALAVLMVVLYHAWPAWLPGGYIGVDVFFVISGFLITRLLLHERDTTGSIAFARFYARRARRLVPALLLVTCTVIGISWWFHAPIERKMLTSTAVTTVTYVSNLWYAALATDYLDDSTHGNALLHSWSLSVEEQFYLVWPGLLWLLSRRAAGASRRRLALGIGTLGLLSLGLCLWTMTWAQPWAFFGAPTRAWEFAAGALAALVPVAVAGRLGTAVPQWGALAVLVACGGLFTVATAHPGWWTTVPVAATCLLLFGLTRPGGAVGRLLSWAPAQWLGDISYSLYLWHWPVLVFGRDLFGAEGPVAVTGAVLLSVLLAQVSFVLVEEPLRHHRRLSGRPATSLLTLGAASAACVALMLGVRAESARDSRTPTQVRYVNASHDRPRVYRDDCHADYFETEAVPCVGGVQTSPRVVVLFGDSHAAHWFPAFDRLSTDRGLRLVSLTKSSCPASIIEPVDPALGRRYVECTTWARDALADIKRLQPEMVVVSVYRGHLERLDAAGLARWHEGVERLVADIGPFTRQLILLADVPRPGFNVPNCLARADWQGADSDRCAFAATPEPANGLWARSGPARHNVRVVEPRTRVCPGEPCQVERGRVVLYTDSNHLTATFSRSLAPDLAGLIDTAFASPAPGARVLAHRR